MTLILNFRHAPVLFDIYNQSKFEFFVFSGLKAENGIRNINIKKSIQVEVYAVEFV